MNVTNVNDKKRYENYDILRAIACISVVILHVSGIWVKDAFSSIISESDYYVGWFYRIMTNMAVPTFVMLGGAFLLDNSVLNKNMQYSYFYKKMYRKIIIPTVAFSVIWVFIRYSEIFLATIMGVSGLSGDELHLWTPIIDCINGVPHITMWYMFMTIGLYIITPVLARIKQSISDKNYFVLSLLVFVWSFLISYTCEINWLLDFTKYIGYFMIGNVIYEKTIKRNPRFILGTICISFSYFIFIIYYFSFLFFKREFNVPDSFSFIVILGTIIQFIGFSLLGNIKANNIIKTISRYSLSIYLLHPLFCEFIMQFCGRIIKALPKAIFIPLYSIIILLLCTLVTSLYEVFKKTLLKRGTAK